jgi:hypothetical protein
MIPQLAVLVYGSLTLVMAFALSVWQASFWGAFCATTAAGVTYLFQALQVANPDDGSAEFVLFVLWLTVIGLTLASFMFAIWS